MSDTKPLVIDILGANGSGKTALLRELRDILQGAGYKVAIPQEDLDDLADRTEEHREALREFLKTKNIVLRTTATNRALYRGPK